MCFRNEYANVFVLNSVWVPAAQRAKWKNYSGTNTLMTIVLPDMVLGFVELVYSKTSIITPPISLKTIGLNPGVFLSSSCTIE